MPAVFLCLQAHRPCRLRRYTAFDVHRVHAYADVEADRQMLGEALHQCYLPVIRVLLALIRQQDRLFRIALSLSGVLMEQFERHHPDALDGFRALADTGCVEFLNETYYHSPVFLFSRKEFEEQVLLHQRKIKSLFNQKALTFNCREMPYSNDLAMVLEKMGHRTILAGRADGISGRPNPDIVYRSPGCEQMRILLGDGRLSDAMAGCFSDPTQPEDPLTAEKYARRLHRTVRNDAVINLFMDFENFGRHHGQESGGLKFLREFPSSLLKDPRFQFQMPAEGAVLHGAETVLSVSGGLTEESRQGDLTTWSGNAMQTDAIQTLYRMEERIRRRGDEQLHRDWRMLQTSDHFSYMCTQRPAGDAMPRYSNPYSSPYDAYINYMNILDDLSERCSGEPSGDRKEAQA